MADVGYGPQCIFITSWCGDAQESVTAETRQYTCPFAVVGRYVVLRYRGEPMAKKSERQLYLNTYEGEDMQPLWCWNALDTDEASQEFESKEAALEAWRNEGLQFSRLAD